MELNKVARIWWLFMFSWGWKKLSVGFGWTFFPPINITIYNDKTSNPQQSELLHPENSSRTVRPSLPLNNSILFFIFTLWNVLALRLRPSEGHKNALTDRKCKLVLCVEFCGVYYNLFLGKTDCAKTTCQFSSCTDTSCTSGLWSSMASPPARSVITLVCAETIVSGFYARHFSAPSVIYSVYLYGSLTPHTFVKWTCLAISHLDESYCIWMF